MPKQPSTTGSFQASPIQSAKSLQTELLAAREALSRGEYDAAIARLKAATTEHPDHALLHHDLACALREAGALEKALEQMRRAAKLDPGSAEIHNNLAGLLERLGRIGEAIKIYRKATELAPELAVSQCNLAELLSRQGSNPAQREQALTRYRLAATLEPELQPAWHGLGETLLTAGRPKEALGALRRAAELQPISAVSLTVFGDALQSLGKLDEAVAQYRNSLAVDADLATTWYGLGHAEQTLGRQVAAAQSLARCVELDPDHHMARNDLGKTLHDLGCIETAVDHFKRVVRDATDNQPLRAHALMNLAIMVPGNPADDNRSVLALRKQWAAISLPKSAGKGKTVPRAEQRGVAGGILRVGYVSSFFQNPNWMKPVWALLNNHDREHFEIHLFSDAGQEQLDPGYRPHPADHFYDISGQRNAVVAKRVREARLDLLIDLNGYSNPQRLELFALRPAPLIVGWFNMYATTGMACFDYLIGDQQVIPTEEQTYYCEKILRVPGSYLSFNVEHPAPDVTPPPCLQSGSFTMGCLASQYKINDAVLRAWAAILKGASDTRLLVKNTALGDPAAQQHFRDRLVRAAIDPARVTLQGPAPHYEFIGTYNHVDIALDTFPYNGGTTTMEAIWQGVPLLTYNGDRWASRTSASILVPAGLGEFVAADVEGHIAQAIELADRHRSGAKLAKLRSTMRERLRASQVMDLSAFARAMEQLYQDMHAERTGSAVN